MGRWGLLLVMGLASAQGRAQYTDVEVWLGSGVKQTLSKEVSWSLQWENRWTQGVSWHDQGMVDVSLNYRLNKHWDVNGQWRWSERQSVLGGYTARRRVALRVAGAWSWGPGEAVIRLMGTEDWEPVPGRGEQSAFGLQPTMRLRMAYAMRMGSHVKTELSWEGFRRAGGALSERWQISAGRDVTENWDVELAYLWGNEWGMSDPWRSHVIRLQTGWTLPDRSKARRAGVPPTRAYSDGKPQRMSDQGCEPCKAEHLVVTEVHTKGTPADYIELENMGSVACDVFGWKLTDELEVSGWEIPRGCLPPHTKLLAYEGGRDSFNFGLSSEGETLYLVSPEGVVVRQVVLLPADGNQAQGVDGTGHWGFLTPSPGRSNSGN